MSTHSNIGTLCPDGSILLIYVHYDGYPNYMGNMLLNNYNSNRLVDDLILKRPTNTRSNFHNKSLDSVKPKLEDCILFNDNGDNNEALCISSINEVWNFNNRTHLNCSVPYIYLWDEKSKYWIIGEYTTKKFIKLSDYLGHNISAAKNNVLPPNNPLKDSKMFDLQTETGTIVTTLTSNDNIFSVYDVTKLLRSLTDENVKHDEVRQLVHGLFNNGGMPNDYLRDYSTDGNGYTLYLPNHRNVSEYDPAAIKADKGATKAPVAPVGVHSPVAPIKPSPNSTVNPDDKVASKGMINGRLTIPVRIAKSIGVNAGDIVSVFYSTGVTSGKHTILICKNPNAQVGMHVWGNLKCDTKGNIRLSKTLVNDCGLRSDVALTIKAHNQSISIN